MPALPFGAASAGATVLLTARIASTVSFAKKSESAPIILEDIAVLAVFSKVSLPSLSVRIAKLSSMYLQACVPGTWWKSMQAGVGSYQLWKIPSIIAQHVSAHENGWI